MDLALYLIQNHAKKQVCFISIIQSYMYQKGRFATSLIAYIRANGIGGDKIYFEEKGSGVFRI
jgi:hypothetical protein